MLLFRQCSSILSLMTLLLLPPSTVLATAGAESSDSFPLQHFLDLEIEGISLSTLPEDVPVILEAAGYFQRRNSIFIKTFIKETPLPGGRNSLYRIELEDTPKHRSITYLREESGGRNKSSVEKNRPIPDNEAAWAKAIYELACLNVPNTINKARSCQPLHEQEIRFCEGGFLNISAHAGAQVNASGASTILGVTYFKHEQIVDDKDL
ncbi:hypothetical protein [Nitrosomonas communis]|uniref:Uncharacterized protein n=1 Tax=Nitrosomonas communis TaxID=44574 RepID=A0A1I4J5C3_9PROT|nr:hypothetical protein [Nitrosomonas communis]SFL61750.1 hypothetical protein SAMN05421863_1001196 [Nitrosomonas communis]